jgi:hypothetical protein
MGRLHFRFSRSPQRGGKLASRLTLSNWRNAPVLRYHKDLGFIRVSLIGLRYFDRGAGGFMDGGAWCMRVESFARPIPRPLKRMKNRIPEILSVAPSRRGKNEKVADRRSSRPEAVYEKAFWTIDEALDYANGEDDGAIAKDTFSARVRLTKAGYKITRLTSESG